MNLTKKTAYKVKQPFKKIFYRKSLRHTKDFLIFPDNKKKRIVIVPAYPDSVIDLEIDRAELLCKIIQNQIQKWDT